MAYDAVIVPGCETLRSTTLERLEAFHAAGGRLIFLGEEPELEDAIPSTRGAKIEDKLNVINNPVSYTHLDVYKRQFQKCSYRPIRSVFSWRRMRNMRSLPVIGSPSL